MTREFPERPVAAVGAVIHRNGEVLLVKRGVEPSIGRWSIPGGAIELGETPKEALVREVREETGLEVEPEFLVDVYNTVIEASGGIRYHYIIIDYLCRHVSGSLRAGSDVEEARWVALSSLDEFETTSTAPLAIRKAFSMRRTREGQRD